MKVSRREALALGGAGLLAGCGPVVQRVADVRPSPAPRAPKLGEADGVRLLKRAGFGPRPGDLDRLAQVGREAWIDAQLEAKAPDDPLLAFRLSRLDVFRLSAMEMRDLPLEEVLRQLQTAAILRAVYSDNQLHERMCDFWTDHFNVYGRKGWAAYRKGADETLTVRKHALGNFRDMVVASAKSPAMLAYLDNRFSKKGEPNENYARELLELHTLGVDGGYTHQDIDEVARCFTGWTLEDRFLRPRGNFRFDEERHDNGDKRVLGQTIRGGRGMQEGLDVIDLCCQHPATAAHLAKKLCRTFLGEDGKAWEARTAKAFLASRGDIRATIRPMLVSPDLDRSGPVLQRPFDFMVASLRATGAKTEARKELTDWLNTMGQPLYQWPMPDGYPTKTSAWTASLLPRWNFAFALAQGRIAGTSIDLKTLAGDPFDAVRLAATVTGQARPGRLADALATDDPATALAVCLAAPEFQWR
jgi:uncharacterized protein (DUF1800 family)